MSDFNDEPYTDASESASPAADVAGAALRAAERLCDHHLANLKYRQTGQDPKNNGYAYAEIPDWALRQLKDSLEAVRLDITALRTAAQLSESGSE